MDGWIQSRYEENRDKTNSIQFPECPKCKTQIRNTLRYSKIIKQQLDLLQQIKLKQYGDPKNNENVRIELNKEIKNFNKDFHLNVGMFLKKKLLAKLANRCSHNQLAVLSNSWIVFKKLNEIKSKFKLPNDLKEYSFQMGFIDFELNKVINLIYDSSRCEIIENKTQRMEEIHLELERIENLANLFGLSNEASKAPSENKQKINNLLSDLQILLFKKANRFDKVKPQVEDCFRQLKVFVKFELSKAEKAMIVQAMGLSQGFEITLIF